MNRRNLRLSLSRKRRREPSNEEFESNIPVLENDTGVVTSMRPRLRTTEQKNHFYKDSEQVPYQKAKAEVSEPSTGCAKKVSDRSYQTSNKMNNIAAWLKKPSSSKITQCPACNKVVLLAKINQHLDEDCVSGLGHFSCDSEQEIGDRDLVQKRRKSYLNIPNGITPKGLHSAGNASGSLCCSKGDSKFSLDFRDPVDDVSHLCTTDDYPGKTEENHQGLVQKKDHCLAKKCDISNSHTCTNFVAKPNGEQTLPNNSIEPRLLSQQKLKHGLQFATEEQTQASVAENFDAYPNPVHIENSEGQNNKEEDTSDHEPYYLSNFKLVLNNVFSNQHDKLLFNEDDNKILDAFTGLSPGEQKLYIRLFQRKRGWFRCSKLEYPRINKDLSPILNCLVQKGFLEDESQLVSLREALNLVAAPDLKSLVRSLHISSKSTGSTKEDILEAIINQAENQRTLFGSFKSVVLKRAKDLLGSCVRVTRERRDVFCRVLLLFTMNVIPDDDDATNNGQAQHLSTLYLANIGRIVYPSYLIDRPTPVFSTRDSLIAFSKAYQQKHEMLVALESNNFEVAYSYYPEASKKFKAILAEITEVGSTMPASQLPGHLRCFTAEWMITKMCYFGVEVLQKWRRYAEAVDQLELLLQQNIYCFDSHGHWYDRLALNLHQHLKQPEKAMEVIRQGLADPYVRFGRRLALVQRAKRILSSPSFRKKGRKNEKKKQSEKCSDLDLEEPNPPQSITGTGIRCAELGVFISPEIDQDGQVIDGTTTFCAVEQYALSHYRQQGFDQGIHGEGSPFTTLFGLFMWNVIFSSGIPDVFRSPFQAAPLDMCFDSFYINRKEIIDKRLQEIKEASVETLNDMLSKSWTDHEGQVCAGVNWELFSNADQAKQLVSCLGGAILSGIFTRFAQGYRYYCAGFPDLVVWNSTSYDYRISEVKGPGDKLSTKQQIWLDILESLGANAEVCYVSAVGAKRLKATR